jgi:hypothetical protein
MARSRPPPFIRLVQRTPEPRRLTAEDFEPSSWQRTLFAEKNPALLAFVDIERATEADFLTILVGAQARFVIDLRLVPRFDIAGMNRKLVFALFDQAGTQYIDFSGRLGLNNSRDARLNPPILTDHLRKLTFFSSTLLDGPIVFLVDAAQFENSYINALADALSSLRPNGWEVLRVPYANETASGSAEEIPPRANRRVVFISHANPEDNAFTLWLCARLACAGYEVWSDVTNLMGGEEFWDTIEEAIRRHAVKVVAVLSRRSQIKQGVLDEINCAISVERADGIDSFVIPVRIDDLPFNEVRANLARKNIIDFEANWATGLSQLMSVFERDGVPRIKSQGMEEVATWCREHLRSVVRLKSSPETLISNWLRIKTLPDDIRLHNVEVPAEQIARVTEGLKFPTFRYLRLIGSFTNANDLQGEASSAAVLTEAYSIPLVSFLNGKPSVLPGLQVREAQNFISSLLRQAWNNHARRRGLLPYEISSGAIAWFLPAGHIEGNRVSFLDLDGKRRRKQIVGWSDRRQAFWHLALELRPVLGRTPRMIARTHVAFTNDGKTLLSDKNKLHALRRRFCKNWWNDRWRDLLLAFLAWLSDGHENINLNLGTCSQAVLEKHPLMFVSPISISDDFDPLTDDASDEGEWIDALDEGEDEYEGEWEEDTVLVSIGREE